jgi:hypothetical protein
MQIAPICPGIMSRNTSSRGSIRGSCANPLAQGLGSGKHKVAPAPPQLPDDVRVSTPTADNNNQPKNGINWPSGSIPRRVKKLSWDDECCQQKKVSANCSHFIYGTCDLASRCMLPDCPVKKQHVSYSDTVNLRITLDCNAIKVGI